jgi:hypothetical protein
MLPGQELASEAFDYFALIEQDILRPDNNPKELILLL